MIELVNNEGQRGGNQDSDINGKGRGIKVFAVGRRIKSGCITVLAKKERAEERREKK